MMATTSRVSVIIPTYYRNDRLRTTIECILQQTHSPIEVIVVDDSGDYHAKAVVAEFDSIKYIGLDENRGPNIARTRGIEEATGDYIQLLDDDDQLFETKIEEQISRFQQNEELVVVYSGGVYEGGETFLPATDARGDVLEQALTFDLPACITSSMLIRREPLLEVMPLPNPPGSDDTYLKIELAQQGPFDFVQEPLLLKGEDPNARSYSSGAVEGTYEILTTYEDLYDQFPTEVRQQASAAAHYREGKYHLQHQLWSADAITSIWRACRIYPGIQPKYWLMLWFSLFGKVGFLTQQNLKAQIRHRRGTSSQ